MKQQQILERLPLHVEEPGSAVTRLIHQRRALAVITEGENGVNLYPGPRR